MGLENQLFYSLYMMGKSTLRKKNTTNSTAPVIRNTTKFHFFGAVKVENGEKV